MERDTERGWRGEEDATGGMWSLRDSIQCSCNAGCIAGHTNAILKEKTCLAPSYCNEKGL